MVTKNDYQYGLPAALGTPNTKMILDYIHGNSLISTFLVID